MNKIGGPYIAPKGRGGIYDPHATGDPFFDFAGGEEDVPTRIRKLVGRLAESSPVIPILKKYDLYYGQRAGDRLLMLRCTVCRPGACECGNLAHRANELMVECYHDPELRPIFDDLKVAVRE